MNGFIWAVIGFVFLVAIFAVLPSFRWWVPHPDIKGVEIDLINGFVRAAKRKKRAASR